MDTGIARIGRIGHVLVNGSNLFKMHPHVNDEVLTYIRSSHKADLNTRKLMKMKAGHLFEQDEAIMDN